MVPFGFPVKDIQVMWSFYHCHLCLPAWLLPPLYTCHLFLSQHSSSRSSILSFIHPTNSVGSKNCDGNESVVSRLPTPMCAHKYTHKALTSLICRLFVLSLINTRHTFLQHIIIRPSLSHTNTHWVSAAAFSCLWRLLYNLRSVHSFWPRCL